MSLAVVRNCAYEARRTPYSFCENTMPDQVTNERPIASRPLTRRALNALLRGRHAHLGGRTAASRSKRLVEIACAYTREELASERGVGPATLTEVELWLNAQGQRLRPNGEA